MNKFKLGFSSFQVALLDDADSAPMSRLDWFFFFLPTRNRLCSYLCRPPLFVLVFFLFRSIGLASQSRWFNSLFVTSAHPWLRCASNLTPLLHLSTNIHLILSPLLLSQLALNHAIVSALLDSPLLRDLNCSFLGPFMLPSETWLCILAFAPCLRWGQIALHVVRVLFYCRFRKDWQHIVLPEVVLRTMQSHR